MLRCDRCSAIASSHALINNRKGALALYHRASTYLTNAAPHISSSPELDSVRGLEVQAKEVAAVKVQLQGEVERFRALVEMEKMTTKLEESQRLPYNPPPLLKTLSDFPEKGVDFSNLVNFPPRVEPVPAKPIFFDIAWNYIQYPGEQRTESKETKAQQQQESGKKGGLFGSLWGR